MPTSPANDALPNDAEPNDAQPNDAQPHVNTGNAETTGGAGGVDALREEVAALREELARAEDRRRRALADLDNYRKRVEREGDRRAAAARRSVLGEWLEAVDSVDRALRMEPGDPGLSAVRAQMEGILARHGIVRIAGTGERFDPARHEAIAAHPADGVPDYTVLEVARSGFATDEGEVLRPAQVVVARSPAGES